MRAAMLAALGLLAACEAASSDLGRDAWLQVASAQWVPGAPPEASGGPDVTSVLTSVSVLRRDGDSQRITGTAAAGATGIWLGLDGDAGGWIVPAGPPTADAPDAPTLSADVALAADAPFGPVTLRVVAADAAGRPGAPYALTLVADDAPPPDGTLVFALAWDGAADLDLHLIAPDGAEAWSGDPNTWEPPPPGTPLDPDAWRTGGILDRDANAGCRRDPRPREHVIWTAPPPAGHYGLRVDVRSLCGAPAAYWFAAAYRDGALLASAKGVATPDHARLPHGLGAGLTVLEVELPP